MELKTVFLSIVVSLAGTTAAAAELASIEESSSLFPAASEEGGGTGSGFDFPPAMDRECLLEPSLTSKLGSPVRGVLSDILVKRGELVRKGQPLAQLDARAERAAVESAQARLEYAVRRVDRNKELYRDELISPQERDEIETEAELARLELHERQTALEIRTLRSPLTGIVVDRIGAPGEFVEETEVLELAQLDPLNVEVVLPLDLFGKIHKGMQADVTLLGPIEGSHTAEVVVVDRVVDAASSTFRARLQIPNETYAIPSGLRCSVRFPFDGG
ncbi:MAG: efflux RND transporter periplasmic adaptor subunit [Pseudomonadales bacterium]|jgi:RND family efflux transporter MFP subunit